MSLCLIVTLLIIIMSAKLVNGSAHFNTNALDMYFQENALEVSKVAVKFCEKNISFLYGDKKLI